MADVEFDELDAYAPPSAGRMEQWVHLTGAVFSVALIVGMAVWGYKLAVRDVSGVPIVRALKDPMRIAPSDPGGEEVLHQGLSVNAVAAAGSVSPLPDKVVLAPPEIDLTSDDVPGLVAPTEEASGKAVTASIAPEPAEAKPELVAAATSSGASEAVVNSASATVPPTVTAEVNSEDDAVAAALAAALMSDQAGAPAADIGAGITKSPRPHARPETVGLSPPEGEVPLAAVKEVDVAAVAMGTRLVQLGAYDDEASARADWIKLQAQFPEQVGSKSMVVQPAESGGRAFFRLRALGFDDEEQTRQFCAVLLAANASCIPVTQR